MPTGPDILKPTISRAPPALATTSDMADVMALVKAAAVPEPAPAPAPAPAPPPVTEPPAPSPAPPPAPSDDDAAAQAEEAAVVRKPWFVKKIDAANAKAREAEARLASETAERSRLAAEVEALRAPPPKTEEEPAPKKNDFPDPDAYTEALAAWTARDAVRKLQETQRTDAEKRTRQDSEARSRQTIEQTHRAHNERVEKAKAELPDFDKVALREDVNLRFDVFYAIEKSPMGPQLMYAIGKDPAIAAKLNAMDPMEVIRELVGMEHGIRSESARRVTKTEPPIEPLKGGGGSTPKAPEDMTMDEYEAYLLPQLNANRRPFAVGRKK